MKACLTPPSFRSLSSTHWPDFDAPIKSAEVAGRDQGWVVAETKRTCVPTKGKSHICD